MYVIVRLRMFVFASAVQPLIIMNKIGFFSILFFMVNKIHYLCRRKVKTA